MGCARKGSVSVLTDLLVLIVLLRLALTPALIMESVLKDDAFAMLVLLERTVVNVFVLTTVLEEASVKVEKSVSATKDTRELIVLR